MNPHIAQHQEVVGSWVVLDPTGRDLMDCMEVGVVEDVRWDDSDGGDDWGHPRPVLTVRLNTFGDEGENVVSATAIHAVLPRPTRTQLR